MPKAGSEVEGRVPILVLKIDATVCSNELFRHVLVPIKGRDVKRREPILVLLKIDVTARSNELFRDGLMPFVCRHVERRGPMLALVVEEGLRALCR
jgi:hypothetical protein